MLLDGIGAEEVAGAALFKVVFRNSESVRGALDGGKSFPCCFPPCIGNKDEIGG